ncbi:MAG: TldD/PmbA family protein [Candidatus Aminicenantes bacterium]|nr:TldD/PmbA family protein [Candidatus Aminicenantes bacterium]
MSAPRASDELLALAEDLVRFARRAGADEVEVGIGEGTEFSVDVRLGEIENLVQAGSRSLGLRLIKDKKTAYATSSDLARGTLEDLIRRAVQRTELAQADACAGLPEPTGPVPDSAGLDLYDPAVLALPAEAKIKAAKEAELMALADPRIVNSHGASFSTHEGRSILANSNGFLGQYAKTYASLSLSLQAGETDDLVEDFWFSSGVRLADLETPEALARTAVARTVRHLHPRKLETGRLPVVFEPLAASGILGFLFSCVSGMAVYQRASFLADKLGQSVGNGLVTVIDDGLLPGRLGSSPFDSEGVPTRKTVVLDRGILRSFLCNAYAARKLGLAATGNADGGGVGPNNFYLAPGPDSAEDVIRSCDRGLLVVRTLGHGLNPVNGDISQGVFGLFIEGGEIAHPVSEVTISGNLGELLRNVERVGRDLEFRGSVSSPTVKIAELQVAGLEKS